MKQIDFFGCSFTEAPMWEMNPKLGELDILLYSMHTQSTKPVSNFLEFDLAYNNQSGYKVNNFGGGSFGNHVIKEILKNRIKNSNTKEGVAIVQLSALLRNTQSYENIFTSPYSSLTKSQKYGITEFNIIGGNVRNDYFVETDNLEDYYNLHIKNAQLLSFFLNALPDSSNACSHTHLGSGHVTRKALCPSEELMMTPPPSAGLTRMPVSVCLTGSGEVNCAAACSI